MPGDYQNLYNRMMVFEARKRKAIQIMQEAKRKEEDDEQYYSIHNSK